VELRQDVPVTERATIETAYEYACGQRRGKELRGFRNELPDFVPYRYGAPRAAWARQAIAAAIAEHGEPQPRRQRDGTYTA
jgi:hypothetical protein